ncbi:MAG: hypothetical protein K2K80_00025 [Clostridia bacterium]|nr:hypothetical protein [Clostridia bacterium]
MKKYLKTFALALITVCMIACVAAFATACSNPSEYEITVITADESPVENLMIQFCPVGEACIRQNTDENGKVTFDLTSFPNAKEFEVHLGGSYTFEDGNEVKVVNVKDGYSITFTVVAQ